VYWWDAVGDVNRLPLFPVANADDIFARSSPPSPSTSPTASPPSSSAAPVPSPWRHAQDWAQLAVDRPEGAPLPEYVEHSTPSPRPTT
jgi:hypothetical protein